jgi:hypothetical protein
MQIPNIVYITTFDEKGRGQRYCVKARLADTMDFYTTYLIYPAVFLYLPTSGMNSPQVSEQGVNDECSNNKDGHGTT